MRTLMSRVLIIPGLVLALAVALMVVSPVHADDGSTPDATTQTTESTVIVGSTETPVPTETATPTEATTDTAMPETTETAVPSETPTTETTTTETVPADGTLPETLTDLAASGVQLTDEFGNPLTLATEETSELVAGGDPYFTVNGVTYSFYTTGTQPVDCNAEIHCFVSDTPIQAAINYMADYTLTPTDGKLYVQSGTYIDDVVVNGLLNGVSGLKGIQGLGTEANPVLITGSISVFNMATGFFLTNLTVNNSTDTDAIAIYMHDNKGLVVLTDVDAAATGEDSTGIVINHTGDVTLNRVDSSDNGYQGANITASGKVIITNSSFDDNLKVVNNGNPTYETSLNQSGLVVTTTGILPVTLTGVSAAGNAGDGARINADKAAVTIKDGIFSGNDPAHVLADKGNGLWANANILTLDNVVASNNDLRGVDLNINASLTASYLETNENASTGTYVISCLGWTTTEKFCNNTGAGAVTIKSSTAMANGEQGYYIFGKGGITLTEIISADQSNGTGIYIDTRYTSIVPTISLTLVTSERNKDGIEIIGAGIIKGKNVIANSNLEDGLYIDNKYGLGGIYFTISTTAPLEFNETCNNGGNGYTIKSNSAISLTSLDSFSNGGWGGKIDNQGSGGRNPVTLNVLDPKNSMNGYDSNGDFGLYILSYGAVTIVNTDASSNFQTLGSHETLSSNGVFIDNGQYYETIQLGVYITNSSFNNNCRFRDTNGYCLNTDGYGASGLKILNAGPVTLLDVDAEGNDGYGVYIQNYGNWRKTAIAPVIIKASANLSNNFSDNYGIGLCINTSGSVSLTNIIASNNRFEGAKIISWSNLPGGKVEITATAGMGNFFNDNAVGRAENGLHIETFGPVSLKNIVAMRNGGIGVYINSSGVLTNNTINQLGNWKDPQGIVYIGNVFSNNGSQGLYFFQPGTLTLTFDQASGNGGHGIEIAHSYRLTITFNQVVSNDGDGIRIGVPFPSSATTITGKGPLGEVNIAGNDGNGLYIEANGAITLNNINSSNNALSGAYLENWPWYPPLPILVTINTGSFNNNLNGLQVLSTGPVIWKNGSANGNFGFGAVIKNDGTTLASAPVTITNVTTNDNLGTGLSIDCKGAVTLTNVESKNNSINYSSITLGQYIDDVLNEEQTWVFTAPTSGIVTVDVSSYRFTPSVEVYDVAGTMLSSGIGVNGAASVYVTGLVSGTNYVIRVVADDGLGLPYTIDIFEGDVEPTEFTNGTVPSYGIFVDNSYILNQKVLVSNTTSKPVSSNSGGGLIIISYGAVSVTNVDSKDNGAWGLYIDNTYPVVKPAVTLINVNTSDNDQSGTTIYTNGGVTIKTSTSDGNLGNGFKVENSSESTISPITFTEINSRSNSAAGIYLQSLGAVTLTKVYSNWNGGSGINLTTNGEVKFMSTNASYNQNYGAVVITTGNFSIIGTPPGYSHFNGNFNDGLYVEAAGKVTLSRVTARGNGYDYDDLPVNDSNGIEIVQTNTTGLSPVSLGYLETNGNRLNGLSVTTAGAVSLTNFIADQNTNHGLFIDQSSTPNSLFAIILTNLNTEENGADGIHITGKGNVTLSKFLTNNNTRDGIDINNATGIGFVTVLNPVGIYTYNQADYNDGAGVVITSRGAVTVTGVEVLGNGLDGISVDNSDSTTAALVTMTTIISRSNGENGVQVDSAGLVTLTKATAMSNGQNGILVTAPATVNMLTSAALNNGWSGIDVTSSTLKLTGCTWFGNVKNPLAGTEKNLRFTGVTLMIA